MATVSLSPILNGWQGLLSSGLPNNSGYIYTYTAGSTTPLATYTTNAGMVANANPIQLGVDGRPPQEIWLVVGSSYKFVITDSLSNVIATYDNIVPSLSASNNLSDVGNAATALANLGGATAASVSALVPISDAGSIAKAASDVTKLFKLLLSGLTTGTTRTATVPDKNFTFAGIDDTAGGANLGSKIQPFTATTASNILTGVFAPSVLDYRSATATVGTPVTLANASLSLAIPATSNLGMVLTAQTNRLVWLVAYNAGVPVLCVVNIAGGNDLSETGFISPTTIGASSNTANVIYSASAVSANSPYRVVGITDVIFTTGTGWSSPTVVQGYGGQALDTMSSIGYGQTWQAVTRTSGTVYYNLTGKPIYWLLYCTTSPATQITIINGVTFPTFANITGNQNTHSYIVPPGASYTFTASSGAYASLELR